MKKLTKMVTLCVLYCLLPSLVIAGRLSDGEYVGVTKPRPDKGIFVQCSVKVEGDKLEMVASGKTTRFNWDSEVKAWKATSGDEVFYARVHGDKPFGKIWVFEIEHYKREKMTSGGALYLTKKNP